MGNQDKEPESPSGAPIHNSYGVGENKEQSSNPNPTQLGDQSSLKAETSDTKPTENDGGAGGDEPGRGKSLKELAQQPKNRTMLGDPVSLKAEKADSEPTEQDRGALGTQKTGKRDSKI